MRRDRPLSFVLPSKPEARRSRDHRRRFSYTADDTDISTYGTAEVRRAKLSELLASRLAHTINKRQLSRKKLEIQSKANKTAHYSKKLPIIKSIKKLECKPES